MNKQKMSKEILIFNFQRIMKFIICNFQGFVRYETNEALDK